jgi:hypothetical protein
MNCHKNIAEVAESLLLLNTVKHFWWANSKIIYTVGWDKTTQSYTGKTEPVKWVRIHNLILFISITLSTLLLLELNVRLSWSVETYEIQKQFAPLTMGWCINCLERLKLKWKGMNIQKFMKSFLKNGVDKLTAAQMGGLECGKCHY